MYRSVLLSRPMCLMIPCSQIYQTFVIECVSSHCPDQLTQTMELAKVCKPVVCLVFVLLNDWISSSEFLCSLLDFDFLHHDKSLNVCVKSSFDSDRYNHINDTDKYEWLDSVNRTASTRHLHSVFSPCRGSCPSRIDLPWMSLDTPFCKHPRTIMLRHIVRVIQGQSPTPLASCPLFFGRRIPLYNVMSLTTFS